MKKIDQEGSAILFVILFMTILLLLFRVNWRSTKYFFDLVLQRGACEKRNKLTQALLNYGIAYSRQQFDVIMSSTQGIKPQIVTIERWPTTPSLYGARLSLEKVEKRGIKIYAELLQKDEKVESMICIVQKEGGTFMISEFCYA